MKKIILLLTAISSVSLFADSKDLIANGDFQKVSPNGYPENWSIQKWQEPAAVNYSLAAGKDGESDRALSLESSASKGYIVAAQKLKLEPAKKFDCLITRVLNYGIQVELPAYAVTAYVDEDDLKVPIASLKIGMTINLRGDRLQFKS